jgi:YggT family protein
MAVDCRRQGARMFIFANFLLATASVLQLLLTLYMWIVIARALISWVNPDPYNPVVRFLYNATEPLLYRVRRVLPSFPGGIDFSPLLVLVAIYFLQAFLVQSLRDLAFSIR